MKKRVEETLPQGTIKTAAQRRPAVAMAADLQHQFGAEHLTPVQRLAWVSQAAEFIQYFRGAALRSQSVFQEE